MSQYFPEPYEHSGGNVKVELYLSNYATKTDLKEATGIDTFTLASKTDLASLKTKVDDLDKDKIKTVPADLSKLCNVMDNDVVKKTGYGKLVIKVSAIDTKVPTGLVNKTQYDSDKQGLEKKIKNIDRKIVNTNGLGKKMTTTQKLQKLKTR